MLQGNSEQEMSPVLLRCLKAVKSIWKVFKVLILRLFTRSIAMGLRCSTSRLRFLTSIYERARLSAHAEI